MIGKEIKNLRVKKNITQEELGKAIGLTTSMIGMYETEARKPSLEVLKKLADYFKVSTDYLLGKSPFRNAKEADCSIRIATMKSVLSNPKHRKLIWEIALLNISTGYWFTDNTMEYIKKLLSKNEFTDLEYYELSLFVVWEIKYPDDFSHDYPITLIMWDRIITSEVDYWSIPKIAIEEWQSHVEYKEPVYDGPTITAKEAFGGQNAIKSDDQLIKNYELQTIAAHHDGEDWTEEELADIEKFKEFVRSKRKR